MKIQMLNKDKLTELLERAALSVTVAGPEDMSELRKLLKILDQISFSIAALEQGSPRLLDKARGMTRSAAELVNAILNHEIQDRDASLEQVCERVSELQKLVARAGPCQSLPAKSASKGRKAADSQGSMIISEENAPLIPDFIIEAAEHIESAEAALLEVEKEPGNKEALNLVFRAFHSIKGASAFLNLKEIGSLAHSVESVLDLARKGKLALVGVNADVVLESVDMMKNMIAALGKSAQTGEPLEAQTSLSTLLKRLKACTSGQAPEVSADAAPDQAKAEIATKSSTGLTEDKIRVTTARLDGLVNMVGELVIAQSMVSQQISQTLPPEHELSRTVVRQGKITRELQELSMSMRMVPIQGVFQRITRLVRDLSHKAGKDITLTVVGEETELDRNVVEQIVDPLIHMVRNCVDHGIEAKEERIRAGKDPTAHIELRAFHRAGNLVIEVEDDGKGLDSEQILKKAVDNGIVPAEQELSTQQIYRLAFHPGLSTAKQVTSVSGRGVGLDIVKKSIEALRGRVDISSTPGEGSVFTIAMPLTLAMIDGQVVRVGRECYIIPTISIEESIRPKRQQLSSVCGRGELVLVRGKLLPMVRLYRLFDAEPSSEDPTESSLVIVEADGRRACLLVDELLGQQQVVIKGLGEGLGSVKGISGGAIMGNGRVSLILDIPGLIELSHSSGSIAGVPTSASVSAAFQGQAKNDN